MVRSLVAVFAFIIVSVVSSLALADAKADHAALSESANKLSAAAATVSKGAKAADDRAARKKFAPAGQDLADDLASREPFFMPYAMIAIC